MRIFRPAIALMAILAASSGCSSDGSAPSADARLLAALPTVRDAITSTAGYSPQAVELIASPAHLRILVSDEKLSAADQAGRENAATAIATAAENAMASRPEFSSVQVISVAIIHPAQTEGAIRASHTEDVVEFRKGPNQRFSHHIT